MNPTETRALLEHVLHSPKIKASFRPHAQQNKLNKKKIIQAVLGDMNNLWQRFKDPAKITKFVETFIGNHISDFLIRKTPLENDDSTTITTTLATTLAEEEDQRISQDPLLRLKKEMEERRKQQQQQVTNATNATNATNNEVNTEEKNDNDNLKETEKGSINNNNNNNMQAQQMVFQTPPQAPAQALQQQLLQLQQMQQNIQRQLLLQQQQQQQRPQQTQIQTQTQRGAPQPLPQQVQVQKQQEEPQQQPQQQPQEEPQLQPQPSEDRAVIHIDARERNVEEFVRCNPFCIYMNDNITCLISIRDLMVSNIHNDGYLLVQISEYKKNVYENQLNREIQFKLFRSHKDDQFSYYRNVDQESMIRVRDISRITFNIVRPNGTLLFGQKDDLFFVEDVVNEEEGGGGGGGLSFTIGGGGGVGGVGGLKEGDTLTLFDKDINKGIECVVVSLSASPLDKFINNKQTVVKVSLVEKRVVVPQGGFKYAMCNKHQISISLEII